MFRSQEHDPTPKPGSSNDLDLENTGEPLSLERFIVSAEALADAVDVESPLHEPLALFSDLVQAGAGTLAGIENRFHTPSQ